MARPKIAAKSLEKLQQIEDQMRTERVPYVSAWQGISAKVNPSMTDWNEDTAPGSQGPASMSETFDNTAMKSSNTLANGLQSAAFGRGVPWISTVPEDSDLVKDKDAGEWLQKTDVMLARQFGRTSFYDEARGFTKSAADFGTGIMFREHNEARGMPVYHTQHLKRSLIAEDEFGDVDTLFRQIWLTPMQAAEKFGLENLPTQVKQDYSSNVTTKRKYKQYIFPKKKYDLDLEARETGKQFYSLYVCDVDTKHAIQDGGYDDKPFYVWRWARSMDGSPYGIDSPGLIEASNILQIDGMQKDFNKGIQLAFRPPIKATEGLEGRIFMKPDHKHFIRPGQDFQVMQTNTNFDGIIAGMEHLRGSIRESYYTNTFLALQANIERVKTATEVAGIRGENAAILAAMTGRLYYEFLEPAVEDLFGLEMAYGRLPPLPDSLKGQRLRIDLVSPIAQLQKRYMMLNETDEFMARILQVAQVNQEVMDTVDLNEYANVIAEAYNQDKRVVRDLLDVQNIKKKRAAQQETMAVEQMKNQKAEADAKVMAAGSKAPEAGSPVEAMMKGA